MSDKLYAERDIIAQGQHYVRHVEAMTAEDLFSKSDIAAELAHRDIQIERLRAERDEWQARALALFWSGHADDCSVEAIRKATAQIDAAIRARSET